VIIMRGQGATEYLVLLAVVLIVALVSVALLGFFPGMASDAQITQSQTYWQSAQPIAIVESAGHVCSDNSVTFPYMRLRNTGSYPIRITGIIGADGGKTTIFYSYAQCGEPGGWINISDYFYLAPGEEKYFAMGYGTPCNRQVNCVVGASGGGQLGGASSLCQNSTATPGVLDYKTLGFEYISYVEGQQVTKRQIGKEWIVKCLPPF
jgi:hypothetical protein